MDLGDLPAYWQRVDQLFKSVDLLPANHHSPALTARKFDEAQPAGPRTYMAVQRYLSVAEDNHRALISLLTHYGAGPNAPWSLLRPMFECAFIACWILDPEEGRERRRRGLRVEARDHIEQRNHMRSYEHLPEVRELVAELLDRGKTNVESVYRREADQLGIKWDRATQRVNVVQELPKLAMFKHDDPVIPATMVATWRMLSGYEHGLGYAMMAGSDLSGRTEVPGGFQVVLTVNDNAFVTASKATLMLLAAALTRLERLHTFP